MRARLFRATLFLTEPSTPTSEFRRLDLPTLLRPRKATSASLSGGNCSGLAALIINCAATLGNQITELRSRWLRVFILSPNPTPGPLMSYFVFPRPRHDLRRVQHAGDRRHLDLALQRELQHLIHRFDKVQLHVVTNVFR